jgi:hypothetical protein
MQIVLISFLKTIIFGLVAYLSCAAALRIAEARSASSKDICSRVRIGMTLDQIETATTTFQGWQVLRGDGVMVISTRSYRDKNRVCRVAIDPSTHRAISKGMGPLQSGDWPTL